MVMSGAEALSDIVLEFCQQQYAVCVKQGCLQPALLACMLCYS